MGNILWTKISTQKLPSHYRFVNRETTIWTQIGSTLPSIQLIDLFINIDTFNDIFVAIEINIFHMSNFNINIYNFKIPLLLITSNAIDNNNFLNWISKYLVNIDKYISESFLSKKIRFKKCFLLELNEKKGKICQ